MSNNLSYQQISQQDSVPIEQHSTLDLNNDLPCISYDYRNTAAGTVSSSSRSASPPIVEEGEGGVQINFSSFTKGKGNHGVRIGGRTGDLANANAKSKCHSKGCCSSSSNHHNLKLPSQGVQPKSKPNEKKNTKKKTWTLFGKTYTLPNQNIRHFPYTNPAALFFMLLTFYSLIVSNWVKARLELYEFVLISKIVVLSYVLYGLAVGCYFKTMFTPPGKSSNKLNAVEHSMPGLPLDTAGVAKTGWCEICCNIKPERTHHCSKCNECVLRMDHHCVWVHNCIGNNNHKTFYLALLYCRLYLTFTVPLLFLVCCNLTTPLYTWVDVQLLVSLVLSSITLAWVFYLETAHLKLFSSNQTTLETFMYAAAVREGSPGYNPYDSGDDTINSSLILGSTFLERLNPFTKPYSDGYTFVRYPPPQAHLDLLNRKQQTADEVKRNLAQMFKQRHAALKNKRNCDRGGLELDVASTNNNNNNNMMNDDFESQIRISQMA